MSKIKGTAMRDLEFRKWCEDPAFAGIIAAQGFSPQIADGFLEMMIQHVSEAKNIYPPDLVDDAFQAQLVKEAKEMKNYVAEINFYTMVKPEYLSISHPNCQVDNAFYWKNSEGKLEAGLLDFGGISLGSIPMVMANGWIGAEAEMMDEHEESL